MSSEMCRARGCFNHRSRNPDVQFFYFSKNEERRQAWKDALQIEYASKNNVVCEFHFSADCFKPLQDPYSTEKNTLKISAVPDTLLGLELREGERNPSCTRSVVPARKRKRLMENIEYYSDDDSRDIHDIEEDPSPHTPKIPPSLLERKNYWMKNRAERLNQIRSQMITEEEVILRSDEDLVEEIVEDDIIDEDHVVEEIYLS